MEVSNKEEVDMSLYQGQGGHFQDSNDQININSQRRIFVMMIQAFLK